MGEIEWTGQDCTRLNGLTERLTDCTGAAAVCEGEGHISWLAGWLAGWLACWLVGWLAASAPANVHLPQKMKGAFQRNVRWRVHGPG